MKGDFTRFTYDPAKHYRGVLMQQGRVQLDADWNENLGIHSELLRTLARDVIGECGVPLHVDAFKIDPAASTDFKITGGRIYINGLMCELDQDVTYSTQPDYPNAPALGLDQLKTTRTDMIYLDAWYRVVSAIEDPHIREVALGGPDTAERVRLIAQVKVLTGVDAKTDCSTPLSIPSTGGGTLQVKVTTPPTPPDPCEPTAQGGYAGPDNRFYRIEIHDGGPLGTATFKWSRDNGSVAAAVEHFNSKTELILKTLGRDDYLKFKKGDYVEVTDDAVDLSEDPGALLSITDVNEAARTITLSTPSGSAAATLDAIFNDATANDNRRHPKVRRWDGGAAQTITTSQIDLEYGIKLQFAATADDFRAGDYWTFAARVVDGKLDPDLSSPTAPMGVPHAYCKLAVVTWQSSGGKVAVEEFHDCRSPFPPLTEIPSGEGGCECAACVTADSHNQGKLTIQTAIAQAEKTGGGNICLAAGDYIIKDPVHVTGRNIHLRGQGAATRLIYLVGEKTSAPAVLFQNACDCSLERVTVLIGASSSAVGIVNSMDIAVRGCLLLQQGMYDRATAGAGIVLTGSLVNTQIADNLFIMPVGISPFLSLPTTKDPAASQPLEPLLLAQTAIVGNRFLCSQSGILLERTRIYYLRTLRAANNQFDQCVRFGLMLDGWVAPAAQVQVEQNVFEVAGYALALGVGRARVESNYFTSSRATTVRLNASSAYQSRIAGSAIVLFNRSSALENRAIAIISNLFEQCDGHAIELLGQVRGLLVKQNQLTQIAGAGMIVTETGRVHDLAIENNQFVDIAQNESSDLFQGAVAAILLRFSRNTQITNNVFQHVGENVFRTKVAGILLVGSDATQVSGNDLSDIGPAKAGAQNSGVEVTGFVSELCVAQNSVRRFSKPPKTTEPTAWIALRIMGSEKMSDQPIVGKFFAVGKTLFAPTSMMVKQPASDQPITAQELETPNRMLVMTAMSKETASQFVESLIAISALSLRGESAAIENNYFDGRGSAAVVDASGLSELIFSGNRCHEQGQDSPDAVRLAATRVVVAANNVVDGSGYTTSINLANPAQGVSVVGNVVRQPMQNVPTQWQAVNVVLP